MTHEGEQKAGRPVGSLGVRVVLAVLAVLATSGCQDAAKEVGTALYVTAEFDSQLQLTQFQVAGQVEDGGDIPSTLLPENPGRILQSGETFRVLLPEAPDSARVTLRLKGLSGVSLAAEGTAEAQVRAGYEVDVRVELVPWSEVPDGVGTDAGTDSGTPDAGNSCGNCRDGCCRDGSCVPRTFQSCGVGGVDCTACNANRANACSALGTCTCGVNSACSGPNVDRCDNGQCKCGTSGPCGAGQACVNGQCKCGSNGPCGEGQACVNGQCKCGSSGPCRPDQECVNGQCSCTSSSCPNGCCAGDTCEPGTEKSKCGKNGDACQQCSRSCNPGRVCR